MKPAARIIAFTSLFLALSSIAMADVITDWYEKAVTAGYAARAGGAMHSRNMAISHIAMFEAVNSIEPR